MLNYFSIDSAAFINHKLVCTGENVEESRPIYCSSENVLNMAILGLMLHSLYLTCSAKNSLAFIENKTAFGREGHIF